MIKLINISDIKILPNRQRREFKEDELQQLAKSIQDNQLFHPITLRVENDEFYLVSGERRLRAVTYINDFSTGGFKCDGQQVPANMVPFTALGELDPIAREEAECEENIRRVQLTWQEHAAATSRIANLRQLQANMGKREAPTVESIAEEVRGSKEGRQREETRKEMLIAKHLDNPEVAGAKTLEDAWKTLKRNEERAKNEQLAERVGKVFTADVHRAFNVDAREWLKQCSAERYDVILTDPPYGMGADSFGQDWGNTDAAHAYKDDYAYFKDLMQTFCYHSFRVAKREAHAYVFCDIDNFFDLRLWMAEAGWTTFRTPIIWGKPNSSSGRTPWPQSGPRRKYEILLFAKKGDRPTTKIYDDLVMYNKDENIGHNAQKPVDLYVDLLRRTVSPGDFVLDPFSGSGTIFPAAHQLKCSATGLEMDPAAYAIGVKRIDALKGS